MKTAGWVMKRLVKFQEEFRQVFSCIHNWLLETVEQMQIKIINHCGANMNGPQDGNVNHDGCFIVADDD